MTGSPISLAGARLVAMASGALFWPEARLLVVADLHLGRSGRLARRGGTLLPPYETEDTLDRLAAEIERLRPSRMICLGDSFDDDAAATELHPTAVARLTVMMAGRDWCWIAGNHDPGPPELGGSLRGEVALGPLVFRHAARPEAPPGEVSGHYHPKARLPLRTGAVARRCFLHDGRRLILPAFGAYAGGLDVGHPALGGLMGPGARAILTGDPCVAFPVSGERIRATG